MKTIALAAVALLSMTCIGVAAPEQEHDNEPVLPRVILKSQSQVQAALGKPDAPCEKLRIGLKCSYRQGQVEVVFIKDRADWITYNDPPEVGFYPGAPRFLGVNCPVDAGKLTVSGEAIQWNGTCPGLLSVQLFPGEGKAPVDGDFRRLRYLYIKAATP